jgi:ribosomal 50S subunit-recycling heat shock protein
MRLDKFLKISRIIKQRPRAKQLCDGEAVKINGTIAKAGKEVQEGDMIDVTIGDRQISAQVLSVPARNVSREQAKELVKIVKDVWVDESW